MMLTFSAPMPTDKCGTQCRLPSSGFTPLDVSKTTMNLYLRRSPLEQVRPNSLRYQTGFTLTELVVVILIISLMILLAGTNLYGLLVKNTFRGQLMEIVSVMQMAGNSAAETGRKYEVIFDLSSQSYLVRQITTPDLSAEVLEEEIIASNELGDNCRITYVIFDDGVYTNQDIAKFRVGRNGWQCGGKIVFTDASERPYSIIVSRLGGSIILKDGDIDIQLPKSPEEVPF